MILIASIQHTGTWKAIEVLEYLTDRSVCLLENIDDLELPYLMHAHLYASGDGIHFNDEEKHISVESLFQLSEQYENIIIPIRNPVRSISTRLNRHPELSVDYIYNGFNKLPEIRRRLWDKVLFLPIDLCENRSNRIVYLSSLSSLLGSPLRPMNTDNRYISNWTKVNSCGVNKIHDVDTSRFSDDLKELLKELGYNLEWF